MYFRRTLLAVVLLLLSVGIIYAATLGRRELTSIPVGPIHVRQSPLPIVVNRQRTSSEVDESRLALAWDRSRPGTARRWTELLHAARLWSGAARNLPGVAVDDPLIAPLLDTSAAVRLFGTHYHVLTRHGVQFRPGNPKQRDGELHQDDTLAVLAECGVRSDALVLVDGQRRRVADIVRATSANAHIGQQELEWTIVAISLYCGSAAVWKNKFNQIVSVEQLCLACCQRPLGDGICAGTHVPFALCVALQADDAARMEEASARLSVSARARIIASLSDAVRLLAASQRADGSWDADWAAHGSANRSAAEEEPVDQIVVTGHSLEWLALAPPEVVVSDEMVGRASRFLISRMLDATDARLREHQPSYSHAASALQFWNMAAWSRYVGDAEIAATDR
jgi:hypothetical protein